MSREITAALCRPRMPDACAGTIAGDPAAFGGETNVADLRCGVVAGEEAQTLIGLLATANELTRFTSNGHTYEVRVRPLLPDEPETCPTP
ncbi:MAG: hypothetical protein ABJC24_03475 [Chloroflexota bacterium]